MSLNLSQTVIDYLKSKANEKFTAREIAGWIFTNFPDECQEKQARSKAKINPLNTDVALIQQIVNEISSKRPQLEKFNIKTTEGRPRKYYYTEQSDSDEVEQAESQKPSPALVDRIVLKEIDLYPILSSFLLSELNLYSKRIDEKRSQNKHGPKGNKWLYPDVVGLEDLSNDWHREVKDCSHQYFDKKTKLWSFEVKLLVNRSNIREVFFQTVSNSSWANFGYLVAGEIEGTATLKELRMLSSLHGIGFILLNIEDPSESQIIIPAKERQEIDWDNINRLVDENSDFESYIKTIKQFYQTGEIKKYDWDS